MKFSTILRRDKFLYIILPFFLFLALGLYILPDFEFFFDEAFETTMARDNVALFKDYIHAAPVENPYRKIVFNLEFYGTFFNLLAYAFQVYLSPEADTLSFDRLEIKRYVIFFFSFFAYGTLALAVHQVTRSRYSVWLALGLISLMPFYFGHSFNNPKDIPFAVMMTVSSMVIAYTVVSSILAPSLSKKQIGWLVITGIVIGLCCSIRLVGIVTLGFWGLVWIICPVEQRFFAWRRLIVASLIIGTTALIVIWVLHPVAYFQPFSWMSDALSYHSRHPFRTRTLTDGELLSSWHTPWYYLPKWLFAQIPLLWQFLCGVGIICALTSFRKKTLYAQALIIAFLLQLLFLPIMAMVSQTNLYHMGRHFLFVYPPIVFFCVIAIIHIFQFPTHYKWPALVLIIFMAAKIGWDMVLLHPYQSAYFVEPVRSGVNDNWAYHGEYKNSVRWFNEHTDGTKLLIKTPRKRVSLFASFYNTRKVQVYNMKDKDRLTRPFYFFDFGYVPVNKKHIAANCELIYKVTRPLGPSELTFSGIQYCP